MDKETKYEVVCDMIDGYSAHFGTTLRAERKREHPSQAIMKYCDSCLIALLSFRTALASEDEEVLDRILDDDSIFRTK